ncbi:MAG: UvrD-helicase domain-containing protein [Patescibacteria group bacterium]
MKINPVQHKAIEHGQGPLLIVAGAGTGKTTVIAERLAYLIKEKKALPQEILALTFTDKAAGEMEERADILLPYGYVDLWISTFHSFGERILKEHALDIGLDPGFKLLNSVEQWRIIRQNFSRFELEYYKPLGNPTRFIYALLKVFSRAKDENVSPANFLAYAEKKMKADNGEEAQRILEVAKAYQTYQTLLTEKGELDFGDLIIRALDLLKQRKNILEKYRQQFKYILVDEFQDTNFAQYEMLKSLAAPKNNITVVGDDDQCLPGETLIKTKFGEKKIKDIKAGDTVLAAVGKGHTSYSPVKKVFRNNKEARFLQIKTKSGRKIEVTDNHKMFCLVPKVSDKKYYYVYLMQRQGFGWRLGITNDLATRLRLERSADKIIGLRAFNKEIEARFYESLWAAKYGLPTVCFCPRDNMIRGEWLDRLYRSIGTEENARKLACDLRVDLTAHHFCLDSVFRGNKLRNKINLELCYRRYISKTGRKFLVSPKVSHLVSLETSNLQVVASLRKGGYQAHRAKKGYRFRVESPDIGKVGKIALAWQKISAGILEQKFSVGKIKIQHRKALVMPAGNLLPGHYLPIIKGKEIIYDQIIEIKEEVKARTVFDLEIEKTHNFIANGVVVHNSVYKFRGAAISNILEFKKDFPNCEEIVLTENYRNRQNILDLSYKFIQLNNPDRLEARLAKKQIDDKGELLTKKVTKKLIAQNKGLGKIEHLHFITQEEEALGVVEKILAIRKKDRKLTWNDFAILVRANDQANIFINLMNNQEIPYQYVANRGLYQKPEIMDLIAYLKLLDNYHESTALFRVINMPIFHFAPEDTHTLLNHTYRKNVSLYEAMQSAEAREKLKPQTQKDLDKLLEMINKHTALACEKGASRVLFQFVEDSGYFKYLSKKETIQSAESILNINQFFKQTEEFERLNADKSVKNFIAELDLAIEAGEEGALGHQSMEEGPESVKVMTIHQAKGLEFTHVFMVNLVDKRFPSIERKDPIELPDELIQEIIPEGDVHLQEERRLFYVAMTRAKQGLYFTTAEDYGGMRKKRLSRFLYEIELEKFGRRAGAKMKQQRLIFEKMAGHKNILTLKRNLDWLPQKFSFTQLKAFEVCPYQYRFAHILHVPVKGKGAFSFGKTIHNTMHEFYVAIQKGEKPTLEDLLAMYERNWIDEWYDDKAHEERRKAKGKQVLQEFYKINEKTFKAPKFLEQGFNIKIGLHTIKGFIDRVDEMPDGRVEIIDYKTGNLPKVKSSIDTEQLLIYALACQDVFKLNPAKLTFYYIEDNKTFTYQSRQEEIEEVKKRVVGTIEKILKSDFKATPSQYKCKYCDFKEICEYRV